MNTVLNLLRFNNLELFVGMMIKNPVITLMFITVILVSDKFGK